MNEDGSIATLRLHDVLVDLVTTHRQMGMMSDGAGSSATSPVELVVMFDGFPVERLSICHFCVANASLRPQLSSHSEQLLRVVSCAKVSETNAQLTKAVEHNHFAADFNAVVSKSGFSLLDGEFVHASMLVAADKKGVEAFRGCGPCSPWCTCGDLLRLRLPWKTSFPPVSWDEDTQGAAHLLKKVCKHPFPSIPVLVEAAHLPLPGEELPRRCRFCKSTPYASVEEYTADWEAWNELRSDLFKPGKAKFAKLRLEHSSTHAQQYKFELPPLLVGMGDVVPELLHAGDLNVDKQVHKQALRRQLDKYEADKLSTFYRGMGVAINLVRKDGACPDK
eukprot:6213859-Pleurochrysis_carterae.AAC.1